MPRVFDCVTWMLAFAVDTLQCVLHTPSQPTSVLGLLFSQLISADSWSPLSNALYQTPNAITDVNHRSTSSGTIHNCRFQTQERYPA